MRLENRVAIVTGGSRGIGAALARGLAREGAAVVVNYVSNEAAAGQVVADIRAQGGRAAAVQADVRDLAVHERLIAAAEEGFGGFDILVNNAGMARRQAAIEATEDAWDEVLGVNLKGVYFLCQAAARRLSVRGRGKIVNISSVHDVRPMRGNSIYCISKAGLVMLTRTLALEWAEFGIQVNCVSPGAIQTDENAARLADPQYRARVLEKIPANRIGCVEDCVGAVVHLCSSESDYTTGTSFYVDGGMAMS